MKGYGLALCLVWLYAPGVFSGYDELEVMVENLSFAQPLSPMALCTHDGSYRFFEFGEPASSQLVQLAEFGNAAPLAGQMGSSNGVEYVTTLPAVGPMETKTATIRMYDDSGYISVAAMATNTNDCFVALNAEK
eukprot:scaffold303322_cov48-Prasinocladus_malaysianus.AAC.1